MSKITCLLVKPACLEQFKLCLQSLQAQSYDRFECLVLDPALDDSTLSWVQKVSKKDPRVKLIPVSPSMGSIERLNFGLSKVKTAYFRFIDPCSVLECDCFEKQIKALKSSSLVAVGSSFADKDEVVSLPIWAKEILTQLVDVKAKVSPFNFYTALFSKEVIHREIQFAKGNEALSIALFLAQIQCLFPLRMVNLSNLLVRFQKKESLQQSLTDEDKLKLEAFYQSQLLPIITRYVIEPQISSAVVPF